MNHADFVRSVIGALGWAAHVVTLYPVRASEIDAYTGADLSGTSATGVMDVRSVLDSSGDVEVQTELVMFRTDSGTAADIVGRRWSLEHNGKRYDILRKTPDHRGLVDCYLQEYR